MPAARPSGGGGHLGPLGLRPIQYRPRRRGSAATGAGRSGGSATRAERGRRSRLSGEHPHVLAHALGRSGERGRPSSLQHRRAPGEHATGPSGASAPGSADGDRAEPAVRRPGWGRSPPSRPPGPRSARAGPRAQPADRQVGVAGRRPPPGGGRPGVGVVEHVAPGVGLDGPAPWGRRTTAWARTAGRAGRPVRNRAASSRNGCRATLAATPEP